MRHIVYIFLLLTVLSSCKHDPTFEIQSLDEELQSAIKRNSPTNDPKYFVMPESDDYKNLPNQDPHNPITKEKVALGKLLFFETGLAQTPKYPNCYETYSCSSCHVPSKGFLPGRFQGIADGGYGYGTLGSSRSLADGYVETEIDAQGNRPMTVMNVTYMTNTLWSGLFGANDKNVGTQSLWVGLADVNHTGYAGLEAQNIEGFKLHRLAINDKVLYTFGYSKLFDLAFSDLQKDKRYTPETASFAMGAYLRTLLTNEAPFQRYLKGNPGAISDSQKEGALLFFGKAGCISCHKSPSFSAMNFFTVGTKDMYQIGGLNTSASDARIRGRGMFTGKAEDNYKFKVPQLYNLRDYVTFFHGSSKKSIREVVEYKLKAKSENLFVLDQDLDIKPKSLSAEEVNSLIDFLTNSLYDDYMNRYMPSSVLSGYCFPNNDLKSQKDTGCR
ncbi:MAG: cytochrome c peroxidase [Saprospiraceae bacterium]